MERRRNRPEGGPFLEALEPRLLLSVATPWLPGDANTDDRVDVLDLAVVANHFGQAPAGWGEGDFNADGTVDVLDLAAVANRFGRMRVAADITIENTTGEARTDWPVFLTVWKLFGPNPDLEAFSREGFHVFDAAGTELPHALRVMGPDFSLGNDEIAFCVASIAPGEVQHYRVTREPAVGGGPAAIDLVGNPNNLLANGGFEDFTAGVPDGYAVVSNSGATIGADTTETHQGDASLRMTFPVGTAATLQASASAAIADGAPYHFSVWAKCENLSYVGYGFWAGGSLRFDPVAFTGREELTLQDTRDWHCYRFDSGSDDAWGVPEPTSRGAADRGVRFKLGAWQRDAAFLDGDRTGTMWVDEALLFDQPEIVVDRQTPLERAAVGGAVVFARPLNMPRIDGLAHEAADALDAFAMPGERRQLRFGVQAVSALTDVEVSLTALTGPGGTIGADRLDLERLESYVTDDAPVASLPAGGTVEYLLGVDVAADTAPGQYAGNVTFTAGGQTLAELPLTVEVLPMPVPDMDGVWIGGIYNIGYPLDRDADFYAEYGKVRFNYLMLFDYFSTHMIGDEVDLAGAQAQVDEMTALAHVDGGIGLYREPNMSEDQPRKWYQIAAGDPNYHGPYQIGTDPQYKAAYQALAVELQDYGAAQGWPELLYMVSDEPDDPRDVDESMGWLNEAIPEAMTPVDAMFADMVQTWQWYTLPVLDNPADWTGPLVYDYVREHADRFGFCGRAWGLPEARYQPGLMMATTGAVYWHFWHTQGPFAERNGGVERMHHVAAMGAGANDLRYELALEAAIAAHATGPGAATAAEAQAYLDGVFAFANADHDRQVLPYNGVPWDWGDAAFYDRWRETMKGYLVALAAFDAGGQGGGASAAGAPAAAVRAAGSAEAGAPPGEQEALSTRLTEAVPATWETPLPDDPPAAQGASEAAFAGAVEFPAAPAPETAGATRAGSFDVAPPAPPLSEAPAPTDRTIDLLAACDLRALTPAI